LIFWGPAWESDPFDIPVKQRVETLFNNLAGGQYNNLLSQYTDASADPEPYIHNDVKIVGEWVDTLVPPSPIGIGNITAEVSRALLVNPCDMSADPYTGKWCVMRDAQFIVLPQSTTAYDASINSQGLHDNGQFLSATPPQGTTFAYSVVRFTAAYDNALTHEYAETATDPFLRDLKGWTTAGQEQEI